MFFKKILAFLVLALNYLPVEIAKKAVDAALDVIEDEVAKTPNKIDDVIVLPIIAILRKAANIPDNDPVMSDCSKQLKKNEKNDEEEEKESHH